MATKLEFDVEMHCASCSEAVRMVLKHVPDIENVVINEKTQQVFVETTLPSSIIQEKIESTNRKAVLKGIGSVNKGGNLGAAVAAITGPDNIFGVIRFVQLTADKCVIDGTIDGLQPGEHGFHVYEYGDLSDGYSKLGKHFNPTGCQHGAPDDEDKHVGDLGNIFADSTGRATFRAENDCLKVYDIIGRSVGVTTNRDSFSKIALDGLCGPVVAGGVIARSAGLFENPKRLCQCSGRTVWEERAHAQNHSKI